MMKIAVFASGSGSNFQAILDEVKSGNLEAEIALLVCDKPGAKVIERAEKANIPVFEFSAKEFQSKEAFESIILQQLKQYDVSYVVLAGYMRLIGDTLLQAFPNNIINLHPSLLPSFPGKDAIGQAFRAGVKVTGITIHFVDAGMDTGPIIAQKALEIERSDTIESLSAKIHKLEHTYYPYVLNTLFQKRELEV
ncbi:MULTISPECIES: phosphoribosylglycinamide formyltransferase [Bacillaceae]|uniref:phosphoribosylglycinamide formyltransferase n=1 Tax=Bacillaceae TaxID=186817 RepID=UPI000C7892C6|nr:MULTISPECIES: phosphoribosylglycinamide formyltransferase [Bacillaceae]PLR65858.1 phosphoribosylglycinamide formyltransferase [Bacillus sp. UMB0893]